MSKLFSFLFGKPLPSYDSPFLSGREKRKVLSRSYTGQYICHDGFLKPEASPHGAVIAPSGGGKTSAFILNSLFTLPKNISCIVLDAGGDIFRTTKGHLTRQGFLIKLLDLDDPKAGLKYNPLHRAEPYDVSISRLATILIEANGKGQGDPFWNQSAIMFLELMLNALLAKNQKDRPKNLTSLFEMVNIYGTSEQPSLDAFVLKHLSEKSQLEYLSFVEATSEKVRASIISVAKASLSKVTTLGELTENESLFFEEARSKPCIIFIKAREDLIGSTYSFLLSCLYSQLFTFLMELPLEGKPYLPIRVMADEFSSYKIPQFETLITVLRRRLVFVSIILQNLSQLQVYGQHEADTILANCSSLLIFPGVGDSTAERISRMLGTYEKDGKQLPVMSPKEIRMLPRGKALFIHSNLKPMIVRVKGWYQIPRFRKLAFLDQDKKKGGVS